MVGQEPVRACTCAGVAELFFDVGSGGLDKFAEAGAGIGEPPGGQLDVEGIERTINECFQLVSHPDGLSDSICSQFLQSIEWAVSRAQSDLSASKLAHSATAAGAYSDAVGVVPVQGRELDGEIANGRAFG